MILKIFIKCWIFYWLLVLIAPFRGDVEMPWVGIIIQAIFVLCVVLGYATVPGKYKLEKIDPSFPRAPHIYVRLFWFSIFLSVAGSLFLTFDRIVVQGISFTEGLAVAREK